MAKLKNYAEDPEVCKRAGEFLFDLYANDVVAERSTIESAWDSYYNMWRAHVDFRYYNGTSNIYLPVIRKNIEDGIANISTKLFPPGDNFQIKPMPGTPEEYADGLKTLLAYQLSEEMRLAQSIKPALRDLLIKGTNVIKIYFDPIWRCPRIRVLDIRNDFYVYPDTAENVDEALATFERFTIDRFEVLRLEKAGKFVNVDDLSKTGEEESAKKNVREIDQTAQKRTEKLPTYDLVEVHTTFDIEEDNPVPVVITFAPESKTILQIMATPYKLKVPGSSEYFYWKPYISMPYIKMANSFYGHTICEVGWQLQHALNDTANLTIDNGILIQCPPTIVDSGKVNNPATIVFGPRAKWDCQIDAISMQRPPSVLGEGLALTQAIKGMLEEQTNIGGSQPLVSKKMTATEAGIYAQTMQEFITSTITDIEVGLITPLLKKTFYLDQLYLTSEDINRILGSQGKSFQFGKQGSKGIVKKDYMFRWMGAVQSLGILVKAQQGINFMNTLALIPPAALGDTRIGWAHLIKENWRNQGNADVSKVCWEVGSNIEIDPVEENEMMAEGKECKVNEKDNDMHHAMIHDEASKKAQTDGDEAIFRIFVFHIQKHIQQAEQKSAIEAQKQAGMTPALPGQPVKGQAPLPSPKQAGTPAQVLQDVMAGRNAGIGSPNPEQPPGGMPQ